MTFDPTKPVAAKHGRPVRILAINLDNDHPIVAAHREPDGKEHIACHEKDGTRIGLTSSYDLFNPPERKTVRYITSGDVLQIWPATKNADLILTFEDDKLVDAEVVRDGQG